MRSVKLLLVVSIMLLLAIRPSAADEVTELKAMVQQLKEDYETKIKTLETRINQLESSQEQKAAALKEEVKKGALNVDYVGRHNGPFEKGGVVVETPSGSSRVSIGGYMDHEFESFENTDSTFDQHRYILQMGAEIADRLQMQMEYEIEHGGTDASGGGGEAKIEYAFMDYLIKEWINLRAGALLVPFGRLNLHHDSDARELTDRPIVDRDIVPTTWTESGAGFYGEFNPVFGEYEDLVLSYETYVVNGLDDGFTDTGLSGATGSLESDNNNSKAVVGRLVASPFLGHEIGFSSYWGKYNTSDDNIAGVGVDWLSTWGPLELVGEYAHFDVDEPESTLGSVTDVPKTYDGYYVQANYHFWPEFLNGTLLGRGFEDPTFTLVNGYGWSKIDDDADATPGDNEETRYTLGLNYRPLASWVFKMEYQWNRTENEALERGDNNGFLWSMAMGF